MGGTANILDAEATLKNVKINLRNGYIKFNEKGNIEFTPGALKELIWAIPHHKNTDLENSIKIKIKGKRELTLGNFFTLIRTVSNSLHSVNLNTILYKYKQVLRNPELIRQTVKKLSSKQEFRRTTEKTYDPETIDDLIKGNIHEWRGNSRIHPSLAKEVEKRLINGQITTAEDYFVLTSATGLHFKTAMLTYSLPRKLFYKALAAANNTAKVNITISEKKAKVTNTGLGKVYAEISKLRLGAGTSNFLQEKTARIKRGFRTRRKNPTAITKLHFRRTA